MDLYSQIKKSLPKIEKLFNESALEEFMNCNSSNLSLYHFGLGTWIRNNLLQENTRLYNTFIKFGIVQKDAISSLIISQFHAYLQDNSGHTFSK